MSRKRRRFCPGNRKLSKKTGRPAWEVTGGRPPPTTHFSASTKSRNYSGESRDIPSRAVYICRVENITVTCAIKTRQDRYPFPEESPIFLSGNIPRPPIFINLEEFMFGPAAPLLNERLIDVYTILN
jgi:hypothetical protein